MLAPLTQLVLLVTFGILGVLVGFAQLNDSHTCRYCHLEVTGHPSKCPHCLCRLD